jgi:hypothetical protein
MSEQLLFGGNPPGFYGGMSDEEILEVAGVGPKTLGKIRAAQAEMASEPKVEEPEAQVEAEPKPKSRPQGVLAPQKPEKWLAHFLSWTEEFGPDSERSLAEARKMAQEEAIYRIRDLKQAVPAGDARSLAMWTLLESPAREILPKLEGRWAELVADAINSGMRIPDGIQRRVDAARKAANQRPATAAMYYIMATGELAALIRGK